MKILLRCGYNTKTNTAMGLADKARNKMLRLGQKTAVGAVQKHLGSKWARGLDAGIDAYRATPTAGIPNWVPKGPQVTNVRKMQMFYRDREPYNPPPRATQMVNRYVTQNTSLGRQMLM
jgi:hypothetical protein